MRTNDNCRPCHCGRPGKPRTVTYCGISADGVSCDACFNAAKRATLAKLCRTFAETEGIRTVVINFETPDQDPDDLYRPQSTPER